MGYLLGFFGILCWAIINGVVLKWVNVAPAFVGSLISIPGAVAFLYPALKDLRTATREQLKLLGLLGLVCALSNSLFYTALAIGELKSVILIHYAGAIIAILIAPRIRMLNERLDAYGVVAVLLGIVGLIYISGSSWLHPDKAFIFAVGSAFGFAAELILSKLLGVTKTSSVLSSFSKLSCQAFFMPLVGFFILRQQFVVADGEWWKIGVASVILPLSFVLVFGCLKLRVPMHHFAVMAYLDRLGAIAFGVLLWHEALDRNTIIGGLLILAAEVPIILSARKREKEKPSLS